MGKIRLVFVCAAMAWLVPQAARAGDITYRVRNQTLHKIDPRLFGQFMERPSWGEVGPLTGRGKHYALVGRLNDKPVAGEKRQIAEIAESPVQFDGKVLKATLPPRTVSVIELTRKK